jgi:1-phosphatidylinositol phosphodiesterase
MVQVYDSLIYDYESSRASSLVSYHHHVEADEAVYHGERNQRTTFVAVLADLLSFLASHPTETVITSLKDEKRHEDFSRLLWLDMVKHRDIWFLENRVPTLGEVRGKAIIMGRFWCSKLSQREW